MRRENVLAETVQMLSVAGLGTNTVNPSEKKIEKRDVHFSVNREVHACASDSHVVFCLWANGSVRLDSGTCSGVSPIDRHKSISILRFPGSQTSHTHFAELESLALVKLKRILSLKKNR